MDRMGIFKKGELKYFYEKYIDSEFKKISVYDDCRNVTEDISFFNGLIERMNKKSGNSIYKLTTNISNRNILSIFSKDFSTGYLCDNDFMLPYFMIEYITNDIFKKILNDYKGINKYYIPDLIKWSEAIKRIYDMSVLDYVGLYIGSGYWHNEFNEAIGCVDFKKE